jgi:hypothetical protein
LETIGSEKSGRPLKIDWEIIMDWEKLKKYLGSLIIGNLK